MAYLCRHEANRARLAALGGVPMLLEMATPFPWRAHALLHDRHDAPLVLPLEVNIVLVGFDGDGGYRYSSRRVVVQ